MWGRVLPDLRFLGPVPEIDPPGAHEMVFDVKCRSCSRAPETDYKAISWPVLGPGQTAVELAVCGVPLPLYVGAQRRSIYQVSQMWGSVPPDLRFLGPFEVLSPVP